MKYFLSTLIIMFYSGIALTAEHEPSVLIAYHSLSGNTETMAKAIYEGVSSVEGVNVKIMKIKDIQKEEILSADAIIVGSPVHNANITPAVQRFINRWPFKGQPLQNKIGAAFVTAGGISAGEEIALMNILHSMLIYNMIVVGGAGWTSAFGASAIVEEPPFDALDEKNEVSVQFLDKGKALGKRVATLTKRFSNLPTN